MTMERQAFLCETCRDIGKCDQRLGGDPRSSIIACPDCRPLTVTVKFTKWESESDRIWRLLKEAAQK